MSAPALLAGVAPVAPDFVNNANIIGFAIWIAVLGGIFIGIKIIFSKNPKIKDALERGGVGIIGLLIIVAFITGAITAFATGALDFTGATGA